MELARRFYERFKSNELTYGTYRLQPGAKPDNKGKLAGSATTIHRPVTEVQFQAHLDGEVGLGLTPLREDGATTWGAIDLDVYPIDLVLLARRVLTVKLPLIVIRSKSGGAHLYLFLSAPAPAGLVRKKLRDWAIFLGGRPDVEVFPKQDSVSRDSLGNWINLPYFGGEASTRYALDDEGKSLGPSEFLDFVAGRAVDPAGLGEINPVRPAPTKVADRPPASVPPDRPAPPVVVLDDPSDPLSPFRDGFSCIVPLLQSGAHLGQQNMTVFHLAVYAKLKYGEDAVPEKVRDWYREHFDGHLKPADVTQTIRSALKKSYLPRCKEPPISGFCNYGGCLSQPFGIGEAGAASGREKNGAKEVGDLAFGELVKVLSDPITWRWTINDAPVEFSSGDLMNQVAFDVKLLDALSLVVRPMPGPKWRDFLARHVPNARVVEVPHDATKVGQVLYWTEKFFTTRPLSRDRSELLIDKTVLDGGRLLFSVADLAVWMKNNRVEGAGEKALWAILSTQLDAQHHVEKFKGKPVSYWSIPAYPEQQEEFEVPRDADGAPPF